MERAEDQSAANRRWRFCLISMSKVLDEKIEKMTEKERQLWALRHTAEHVLHTALQNLYPKMKKAMGPATEDGYYHDFDLETKVTEADFPKIEKEMQRIIDLNLPLVQEFVDETKAREIFKDNPYKLDWVDQISNRGEKFSIYKIGDIDLDLCSGPHVKSTGEIKAFKLLKVAGAYWHGNEKNKLPTRIYGTAFPPQKELDDYLKQLEEAEKRDHRKIGQELELFTISDAVGKGLILWLPKGTVLREEIEKLGKETEAKNGYQRVVTPHIGKEELYLTSGHLPYYAADMWPPMEYEGEKYYVKPMNCPHMHMIYKFKQRSYKELPIRFAEFGTVYRHEDSGTLMGTMRVRGHTTNDAHIYCTEDQAIEEILKVMELHHYYYNLFGIKDYHIVLALPDFAKKKDKYFNDKEAWDKAVKILRQAAKEAKVETVDDVGGAAFYGPKFDFNIKSVTGRTFGASTNQLDFGSGKRFNLTYVDNQGQEKIVPYIIHRAPLGSEERFIGFLIEHFGGAFPTWLAPVQVIVLPIADRHLEYAAEIRDKMLENNLRVELDDRQETLSAKIRDAQMQKIPYMIVIGDKEIEKKMVAVRQRDGKDLGSLPLDEFIKNIRIEIVAKTL